MSAHDADLMTAARTLALDAACVEVLQAWATQHVDSILLKGPTTAEWLYPDQMRAYGDLDLLVAPDRLMDAAATLRAVGFAPVEEHVSDHAHPWERASDATTIDLHVTIWGPTRSAREVWAELQDWTVPWRVGPVETRALSIPARALHVALHAAQHRDEPRQPEDLRRAIERASLDEWRAAEELGDRLRALPMMARGLLLEPTGRAVLAQLPLARAAAVMDERDAPLAIGFARFAGARGARGKLSVAAAALRREDVHGGATGRLAWLLRNVPRTAIAMRRARPRGARPR